MIENKCGNIKIQISETNVPIEECSKISQRSCKTKGCRDDNPDHFMILGYEIRHYCNRPK